MRECKVQVRRKAGEEVKANWEDATFHEFSTQDVPMQRGGMRRMPVAIVELGDGPIFAVRLPQIRFNPDIGGGADAVADDGED